MTKSENSNIGNYFLFSVDNSGNFSLLKIQNEKEEVLISPKRSSELNKKISKAKSKMFRPLDYAL